MFKNFQSFIPLNYILSSIIGTMFNKASANLMLFLFIFNLYSLNAGSYVITGQFPIVFMFTLLVLLNQFDIFSTPGTSFNQFLLRGVSNILAVVLTFYENASAILKYITLTIRLLLNLIVGHAVLFSALLIFTTVNTSLIGEVPFILSYVTLVYVIIMSFFETGVAILQAFLFYLLSSVYTA